LGGKRKSCAVQVLKIFCPGFRRAARKRGKAAKKVKPGTQPDHLGGIEEKAIKAQKKCMKQESGRNGSRESQQEKECTGNIRWLPKCALRQTPNDNRKKIPNEDKTSSK